MATKPVINLLFADPKAVQDLIAALQLLGEEASPERIRRVLYPAANDARDRWLEYLDAAESLNLITRDPLRTEVSGKLDDANFGRLLRQRFRAEERDRDTNSLVYIAYRAALELAPDQDGGTSTNRLAEQAERRASEILGASPQNRYDSSKVQRWRRWINAAGLGFRGPVPNTFVISPVIALRDEILNSLSISGEVPLSEFFDAFDTVPLSPNADLRDETLPIGIGAALRALEDEAVIRLTYSPDARRQWRIAGRLTTITHVEAVR